MDLIKYQLLLIMAILFLSCQKNKNIERIHNISVLDYHNFENDNISISQLQDLYQIESFYNKNHFEVADNKDLKNNLVVMVEGDLFNILFERCFLKNHKENDLEMNVLQQTSKLYYVGKTKQSKSFYSQMFLLKITDEDETFYMDKMIMLNSKGSLLLSVITLSDYICSESCIGRKSERKGNNVFKTEMKSYSSDVIVPYGIDEEYYASFKLSDNGYIKPL
jgi:hypothetical protein